MPRHICFCLGDKMVTVNGEGVNAAGKTVMQYIEEAGYNAQRVVVEKSLVILKKDELSTTVL